VETTDKHFMEPIHEAVEQSNMDMVLVVLESFPDMVNSLSSDGNGYSALHYAALSGDAPLVALLLDYGALIDQPSRRYSFTPLCLACEKGHVEVVDLLISRGATPSCMNWSIVTPLMQASAGGHLEIVQRLLSHHPPVPINLRDDYYLRTALWRAGELGVRGVEDEGTTVPSEESTAIDVVSTPMVRCVVSDHYSCCLPLT